MDGCIPGYQKLETPKSPISENEIRVTSKGLVRNYIGYATSLLQERHGEDIVLKAMGQAICKTITIAELIKRRFPGLHQDTAISSVRIRDVWYPIEEELPLVEQTRRVSMISITLSAKELNKNSPGYQAPSHVEQGKWYNNYQSQPSRQSREVYSGGNEGIKENGCGLALTNAAASCLRGGGSSDDGYDDDCVILEEDPNKPVKVLKVVNEEGNGDSDDLLVVSEKGQVACRDYPHPRHLCAKFPFGTTPHESHCDKCYCYVCDTLAPCLYWGKDNYLSHCNATDKIAFWRFHRENRKKSDQKVESLVSHVVDAAV